MVVVVRPYGSRIGTKSNLRSAPLTATRLALFPPNLHHMSGRLRIAWWSVTLTIQQAGSHPDGGFACSAKSLVSQGDFHMTDPTTSAEATKAAASISAASQGRPTMDKIIVAIHGIGSQVRSETIRSVARRFGDRSCPPLPVMPLGFFNLGSTATFRVSRLDAAPDDPLSRIGFAEIYWADIPEQVVKANDTLEETKAWGRTIVSRAEAQYRKRVPGGKLTPDDFQLGIGVVEEIIETVGVLENLFAVLARMGIFKFELAPLLRDYVGDVQLVTDFPFYRGKIAHRFHTALAQILATFLELYPGHLPEIYIVAHSEGTVISFLGLLEALSGRPMTDPADTSAVPAVVDDSWITCVRGYMTIGSPIDKHVVLWPALWEDIDVRSRLAVDGSVVFREGAKNGGGNPAPLKLSRQIKWRNYYDLGDPIGFQLDSAMDLLKEHGCSAFDLDRRHDHGFSRYWLPGKAHNDYWNDAEVFGHFIEDVVLPKDQPKPPSSNQLVDKVSMAIPYLFTFLLHLAAVYLLYKAVIQTSDKKAVEAFDHMPLQIALLSLLLTSISVAARLPRLVNAAGIRWHLAALVAFLVGAVPCAVLLPDGPVFSSLAFLPSADSDLPGRASMIVVAFLIALSGWLLPRRPKLGRRTLVGFGTAVIALIVIVRLADAASTAPVWPVLLSGAAFLYLWWLGILMFDLTFIWHRYVRRSVAVNTLRQWKHGNDAKPNSMMGLGAPQLAQPAPLPGQAARKS
jgi:hypothetical protein